MEFLIFALAAILIIIVLYGLMQSGQSNMTPAQAKSFQALGGIHGQSASRLVRL